MVEITKATTPKTILSAPELAYTLPIVVDATGLSADSNGKKILAAGTPITGDLMARNTAFKKATTTSNVSNAVGILLHEVDVTGGNANGTIVVSGAIDVAKIDTTTAALYTTEAKAALNKIIFMKGV